MYTMLGRHIPGLTLGERETYTRVNTRREGTLLRIEPPILLRRENPVAQRASPPPKIIPVSLLVDSSLLHHSRFTVGFRTLCSGIKRDLRRVSLSGS